MKFSRTFWAVVPFLVASAFALAGSGTLTVLDGNTTKQNFGVTTDGSGNLYSNNVIVDGTAAGNKAAVTASNALKVDGSAVTQPANVTQIGGAAVALGQAAMAASIPVAIANNQGNVPINNAQVSGTAVDTNSGTKSAGTQRIVIATDQPALTNAQPANIAQVNGVTSLTGAGAVGTGSPRVAVGQDTTTISGSAPGTAGSASANVLSVQGIASMTPINVGTHTATSALYATGTNGFTTAPFNIFTTDLNTWASTQTVISSVNGTSGKFNQTTTGSALFGRCWYINGTAVTTPTAGANISLWFLTSTDGGTTFEAAAAGTPGTPPPRSPDIIIPVATVALTSGAISMSPPRQNLWAETVKIVAQNNTGVALTGTGQSIVCGPEATQN